jgi:type I restriction enzyme S subunit
MELLNYTDRWNAQRLGSLFSEQKEKNADLSRVNALKFTYGSIVNKPTYVMTPALEDTYSKYTKVDTGDIVINCLNLNYDFVSQRVAIVKTNGIITSAYITLRARNSAINPMYYCYYFKAMDSRKMFHGMGTGIRLTLSYKELRNTPIPVPPRAEQDQIVRFLDWKVSEINKLISIRRKEIQELKALKSAVIDSAITMGVAPHGSTKKTGVYYLPEVPDTWKITKLKRICKVGASIAEQLKKHSDQDEVVFLPMENISEEGEIDCSIKQPIEKVKTGFSSFAKDDVVVAKITPCFENGKGACLDNLESDIGYGTTELFNLRAGDDVLPEYLYYITMTKLFRILGEGQMTGSAGQKRVPADFIRDFTIGLPSIDEQYQILAYIRAEKNKIDKLISTKHKQLNDLLEFKSTIISDVVTGKIDVRGIAVPQYEHIDDIAEDDSEDIKEEIDGEEE